MYLDDLDSIPRIAQNTHFSVFITGNTTLEFPKNIKNIIPIPPGDKGTYDIESVRTLESLSRSKQITRQTFLIEQADALTPAAQNAFLKLLEEPNDNIAFLFIASSDQNLLPTILSRAKVFYLPSGSIVPPDSKTLEQARTLVATQPRPLIALATTLAKDRTHALEVIKTAISELYRSQLTRPNPIFLAKLEKLLQLEKSLKNNGHIKLHIVNMI